MSVVIEYDKLAIGLLEMFDEGEKAVMGFGMIPVSRFDPFMKVMFEEIVKQGSEKSLTTKYKNEVEHEMSLALYRNAKMVV